LRWKLNVSILLCTATQPGLKNLKPAEYALPLSDEIIPDIAKHFEDLKRVELVDKTRAEGWTLDDTADFIEKTEEQSVLTVVNTKSQARKLYETLKNHPHWRVFHLSANMCPAHRRKAMKQMDEYLKAKAEKCVCISTRLIEAGVDIDFDCAIRFLAGFDSIIQTAGRCNRNGALKDSEGNFRTGKTYIINIVKAEEKIASLPDLRLGQEVMERILREFHNDAVNRVLLHPHFIDRYFDYYYSGLNESLLKHKAGQDTVLDLLSANERSRAEYEFNHDDRIPPLTDFRQSFAAAWKKFEVISQDTTGVIVPFEKGADIIAELNALPKPDRCRELLREAQQYSINIYASELPNLIGKELKKIPLDTDLEIYALDEKYYDPNIGLKDVEEKLSRQNA
jgi:CRISPR-associated endonuclease/helicase Cas3